MKAGNILLKNLTGFIIAAVFFAGCLCMGFAADSEKAYGFYHRGGILCRVPLHGICGGGRLFSKVLV